MLVLVCDRGRAAALPGAARHRPAAGGPRRARTDPVRTVRGPPRSRVVPVQQKRPKGARRATAWRQESSRRGKQYEHIKDSEKKQGRSTKRAEEIAARTVNKERARTGEAKAGARSSTSGSSAEQQRRQTLGQTRVPRAHARTALQRGEKARPRGPLAHEQEPAAARGGREEALGGALRARRPPRRREPASGRDQVRAQEGCPGLEPGGWVRARRRRCWDGLGAGTGASPTLLEGV